MTNVFARQAATDTWAARIASNTDRGHLGLPLTVAEALLKETHFIARPSPSESAE
jgi:hypothetical protein